MSTIFTDDCKARKQLEAILDEKELDILPPLSCMDVPASSMPPNPGNTPDTSKDSKEPKAHQPMG